MVRMKKSKDIFFTCNKSRKGKVTSLESFCGENTNVGLEQKYKKHYLHNCVREYSLLLFLILTFDGLLLYSIILFDNFLIKLVILRDLKLKHFCYL